MTKLEEAREKLIDKRQAMADKAQSRGQFKAWQRHSDAVARMLAE